jgi:hypothetical protein
MRRQFVGADRWFAVGALGLLTGSDASSPGGRGAASDAAQDGAGHEGLGYWDYGTRYLGHMIVASETALGTDFGLLSAPGLGLVCHAQAKEPSR